MPVLVASTGYFPCIAIYVSGDPDEADAPQSVGPAIKEMCDLMVKALADYNEKPQAWYAGLVKNQQHSDIVSLDASARARLGFTVEKLIRVTQLVDDWKGEKKLIPFAEGKWLSKASAREGILALMDLTAAVEQEGGCHGLPGISDARAALSNTAKESMYDLVAQMMKLKESHMAVYKDMAKIIDDVESMEAGNDEYPESVRAIVAKYSCAGEPQSQMQDATKGDRGLKSLNHLFPTCTVI